MQRGRDQADYVQKVRGDSQRLSESLLHENERLRTRLAAVDSEKLRLEDAVGRLREELATSEQRYASLERRLQEAEVDTQRFSQDYLEVEQQNQNLANLYVASYRLHGTVDRGELMRAIQEIASNLVGSEEMAVFELSEDARVLSLATSLGVDAARYRELPADRGLIGQALRSGDVYVADASSASRAEGEENLSACIPLVVGNRPLGVIAIFRLLSHKPQIEDVDRELFELLAAQASVALYCTRLHALHGAEILGG